VAQFAVFLVAAVQAIFVGSADGDTVIHALTPILSEGWWTFQRRGQHFDFRPSEREMQGNRAFARGQPS